MKPLLGAVVARSSAGFALPVYLTSIDARATTPGFEVSAQTSLKARSRFSSSRVGSSRVLSAAIVSPVRCAPPRVGITAEGMVLTTVPELIAAPRRGLWQPSQVRRSPGRTWIQLRWVWMLRPWASSTEKASATSAGTTSLNEPSGSTGA